ncbi:glycine-rich domain-containing protein [Taibaiella koreensis]|uniref:glycine-rich domain-containing protein n=1 Tax=Taibaiella koreensis TaxID=1268548 RepID=UPI000E59BF58|nr:hypothetical protein [Taibaiella koreensis]
MEQTTIYSCSREQLALWQKIAAFRFDEPGASFPFSRKLASENGWTYAFSQEAIEEYRKFIFLCCISPHGASPSKVIDEVWHLHLLYTQNYWQAFCRDTLGQDIHHHPSRGGPEEKEKHEHWQTDTLTLYLRTFGYDAPERFWDETHEPLPARNNKWQRALQRLSLLLLVIFPILFLTGCSDGEVAFTPIIAIFLLLMGIFSSKAQNSYEQEQKKHNRDSGGGCSSDGGSSCGSSCSSGCGGCGGGGD